ncbi:MAG: PLP-dependent aminotransferase family protein, partial [Micromonosporaceae bacterium]|nr:PLP-dependent aminotransferase family protein [Micromonosporaceae bacterium]
SSHVPTAAAGPARPTPTTRRWIDLRGGIPDPTEFPRREWLAAVRQVTQHATAADLGYPDPAGTPRLRAALAGYLARTRGVMASPDAVLVGQGFGELLVLVCRALRAQGARRIAVEAYGHAYHRQLVESTGLEVVPIAVDDDGADVDAVESAGVDAVLLTPAHQFPVGVPLAAHRRRSLVAWAQRSGGVVLEDDYDGEFRYDRRMIGALQALAADRVVYLGTASKAVAPAAGLAWAVVPDWLRPPALEQRMLTGGRPSALHQLTMAEFINSHEYDRSVRRYRGVYRARRTRLVEVVADRLPGCAVTGLAAGLQCLLRLPPGADEQRVEQAAQQRGLRLGGLDSYRADGAPGIAWPALVIGYGGPTPGQYERALRLLVDSIRDALDASSAGVVGVDRPRKVRRH